MDIEDFNKRVKANADTLIAIGKDKWIKTRRRNKRLKNKAQQDQLREIEDKKVEDV